VRKLSILSVSILALSSLGSAAVLVTLNSGQPTGSGPFLWAYDAQLVAGTNGGELDSGDFFTIYDVGGISGASNASAPANWTITAQLTGIDPPTIVPPDNPAILNVTFQYTGPQILASGSNIDLATGGTFFVISSADNFSFTGFQASQSHTQPSHVEDSVSSAITVPGSATPEPTTFLLVGAGLTAFGFVRRRRIV
jgi:hypothetical protein